MNHVTKQDQHGENNPNWKGGRSKDHYFYSKRSKQKYPEKHNARCVVARALKTGKLIKPNACQYKRCSNTEIYAHHVDYNHPLAVEWYCRKHHEEVHGS